MSACCMHVVCMRLYLPADVFLSENNLQHCSVHAGVGTQTKNFPTFIYWGQNPKGTEPSLLEVRSQGQTWHTTCTTCICCSFLLDQVWP